MTQIDPLTPDTTGLPANGAGRPVLLSSNTTLAWRVFVPIFGTVFLGGLAMAYLLTNADDLYVTLLPIFVVRALLILLWLGWLYFVWRTLWRLKRVDAADTHMYVSDYWVTVRYPWSDVEKVEEKKRLGRRVVNIHLKASGRFGQIISFLPGSKYAGWKKEMGW